MQTRGLLLLGMLLLMLSMVGAPATPATPTESDAARTRALLSRCTDEVLRPANKLYADTQRRTAAGTWRPGDPDTVRRADAISEVAYGIAGEARRHWYQTESDTQFTAHASTTHALLAADATCQFSRTGNRAHAKMAVSESQLAADLAQAVVVSGELPATPEAAGVSAASPSSPTPAGSGDTVHITKTGKCYHRAGCRSLAKSDIPISRAEAKSKGYTPCSICSP